MLGAPKCPHCKSNRAVEESNYRDEGTHFCSRCAEWFTPERKPRKRDKEEEAARCSPAQ